MSCCRSPHMMGTPRPHHHHLITMDVTPDAGFGMFNQPRGYYHPWKQPATVPRAAFSTLNADKNKSQISLDVQHFTPEEITVKTCDGFVVVEGKHEEKSDQHGWVSRQFRRRYKLPTGCDEDAVESRLSSDGVLTVTAPLPAETPGERVVPVVYTGPVRTQPFAGWGQPGAAPHAPFQYGH